MPIVRMVNLAFPIERFTSACWAFYLNFGAGMIAIRFHEIVQMPIDCLEACLALSSAFCRDLQGRFLQQ